MAGVFAMGLLAQAQSGDADRILAATDPEKFDISK
jgi:hypothetical protein